MNQRAMVTPGKPPNPPWIKVSYPQPPTQALAEVQDMIDDKGRKQNQLRGLPPSLIISYSFIFLSIPKTCPDPPESSPQASYLSILL